MTNDPHINNPTDPNTIADLLTDVCHLKRRRSHELLREVGLHGGAHDLLRQLWREDGARQADLVRHSHVRAATISKNLQRMEEAGLVTRRRDDIDQRVVRVYLTDEGRDLEAAAADIRPLMAAEAVAGLDADQLAALESALTQVAENLRSVVTPRPEGDRHSRGRQRPNHRSRRRPSGMEVR